jgi:hypothetical protein
MLLLSRDLLNLEFDSDLSDYFELNQQKMKDLLSKRHQTEKSLE